MNDSLECAGRAQPRSIRGVSRIRVLLVGARRDARRLLQHMVKDSRRGMTVVGFIDAGQLAELAEPLAKSSYGQYLKQLLNETQREAG